MTRDELLVQQFKLKAAIDEWTGDEARRDELRGKLAAVELELSLVGQS